jgi:FdhD protein
VGFLFNENYIEDASEIVDVTVCASGDNVDVWLTHGIEKPSVWKRTTGCSGGLTSAEPVYQPIEVTEADIQEPRQICALMDQLLESQELYRSSHGVHASVLSDGERVWAHAEDIGRHNTLDKIAGLLLLNKVDPPRRILLTTGRISSEMLQKSSRMKAGMVISRTAPNASSIRAAQEAGITLIGYARRDQFQVYAHAERIRGAPEPTSQPTGLRQAY